MDLCTDLRRVSSGAPKHYESALTSLIRKSAEPQSPWLVAAEQLGQFPTRRCVQMLPADWQELSAILSTITRLCDSTKVVPLDTNGSSNSASSPGFVTVLELLLRLGQVTSCLLCVNGDDRSFSIARVAQAIRTTTSVLQAAIAQATPAGLSAEVADSLARQRCEQTPLLSAVAWALRQEARSLFFNPRPTALSLGTALLDLFRVVEQLWPQGIFVAQQHELSLDDTAARMADPAAQLAMAMLRCAGRAMAEIGPGACRESLLCGLRVAYDMVQQISSLLDGGLRPADEALVKQLQQSPSLPQLMLALLAVETHRLNQQLGVSETDSCIMLQPQQQRRTQAGLDKRHSKLQSRCSTADNAGDEQQQHAQPQLLASGSLRQSRRCSSVEASNLEQLDSPQHSQGAPLQQLRRTLSQQRLLLQQQLQQQQQEEEEHAEIEGAGELHQVWHQVLGMARKNLARDEHNPPEQEDTPRSPLMQLWISLGLPEALLQIAADAGVSPAPPLQQYVAVCRVGRFLLSGSPLLQPQHKDHERPGSPGALPAAVPANGQLSVTAAAGSTSAAGGQLSPFAGHAGRTPSRSLSGKPGGMLPPFWHSSSPTTGGIAPATSPGSRLAAAYSIGDSFVAPPSFSSPSAFEHQPASALSLSAEAAEQLVEDCRDFGLRGQEELELLRLQRVVPVVLLNTAAGLLQRQTHTAADASNASSSSSTTSSSKLPAAEELEVVRAACTAAACVSRCWPVLQKVAAQQEELCDLLAECHPPSGVFAGLTTVRWQPYTLPSEVRLPMLQLLQLVVKLIWLLQPPWQQRPPWQQQQQDVAGLQRPPSQQQLVEDGAAGGQPGPIQILSPEAGECMDSLLEVLTAVSKLPWEPAPARPGLHLHKVAVDNAAHVVDDAASDDSSKESAAEVDAQLVAEAWREECQPVAAAVEACLRTAGQVAAAADGALDWRPVGSGTCGSAAGVGAAAGAAAMEAKGGSTAVSKVQRHPSAVALGSCLASLCAPFGRPGPLVAAAAAAPAGGPEQQQLFALLLSKLKVLLYNPASKKASLIAMHPIEQTPIYIIRQLHAHSTWASAAQGSDQAVHNTAVSVQNSQQQPTAGRAGLSAAMLPWLLLLSRLMVLRGKLLGHLLVHEADEAGKERATSALHTAYWYVTMAHSSASTLAAQWKVGVGSGGTPLQEQLQSELQLQLLPALKQAVHILKAAMKLSRHYHETGFASGFASGFAAGYAAAVAAASGVNGSTAAAAIGPVSFASPWGVLQQSCIRGLPQQLESVGSQMAWELRALGCSNPLCVNLSLGSELWLVPQETADRQHAAHTSCSDSNSSVTDGIRGPAGEQQDLGSGNNGAADSAGDGGVLATTGSSPLLCCSCRSAGST